MVVRGPPSLSLTRQCRLLSIGRSSLHYQPKGGGGAETLALMRRIDELFLKYPSLTARVRWFGICAARGCGSGGAGPLA